MGIRERDPTVIVFKVYEMIRDIVKEVEECVIFALEQVIESKQNKIKDLKWEFPIEYKKDPSKKNDLIKAIEDLQKNIEDFENAINQIRLSFLYAQQGFQSTFNTLMMVYGVTAADTPSISLKGSGDLVLKADDGHSVYVSGDQKVGGPTPAVFNSFDKTAFRVKADLFAVKTAREVTELIFEGTKLRNKEIEDKKGGWKQDEA